MKELLISQNSHWMGSKQDFIKRDKLSTLIEYLPLKQIITISGIRRCGKSSLAKQAINYLIDSGINPYNILFINLEQPYFLEYKHDANYLNTIYEEYLKLANPSGKVYVIFDEIQFFSNWQVFIKSKYESSDIKFIITGSNSSMLSNDLNTLLSGRSLNIHLDTFSFSEYLDFKQISYSNEIEKITNKIAIKRAVEEYMNWGVFYEVFSIENKNLNKFITTTLKLKNIIINKNDFVHINFISELKQYQVLIYSNDKKAIFQIYELFYLDKKDLSAFDLYVCDEFFCIYKDAKFYYFQKLESQIFIDDLLEYINKNLLSPARYWPTEKTSPFGYLYNDGKTPW